MSNITGHLLGGEVVSDHVRLQDIYNPAIGQVNGQVAIANHATVGRAIAAATAAFPEWCNTPQPPPYPLLTVCDTCHQMSVNPPAI